MSTRRTRLRFRELNGLLAAEFNGNPQIEYMDTMMYGFWGEAHTWPFEGNAFPSNVVAEQTWVKMLETQRGFWTKAPLVTNTEPGFRPVGNSDPSRSHYLHPQLDSHGYHLHRKHAD
jgi:hypothetical protein